MKAIEIPARKCCNRGEQGPASVGTHACQDATRRTSMHPKDAPWGRSGVRRELGDVLDAAVGESAMAIGVFRGSAGADWRKKLT